jgi:hypothetical protein
MKTPTQSCESGSVAEEHFLDTHSAIEGIERLELSAAQVFNYLFDRPLTHILIAAGIITHAMLYCLDRMMS